MKNMREETSLPPSPRLPYEPPKLTRLGDIRDLTLGASPGIGDSGSINFRAPTPDGMPDPMSGPGP